jgi:ferredoxin
VSTSALEPHQKTRSGEPAHARSTPPGAAVRGEGLLIRLERAVSWVDGQIGRLLPHELNPLAQAGRACNFAIVCAVVSGVLLLVWYSPSLQSAYTSIENAQNSFLGSLVRAAHRYSSDLVMLLVLVHAGRMFLARKFSGARWIAWASGVALMGLLWFIGWTGYWLLWDQPAQQVAVSSMRLLDALPIFGEPMGRLYVTDRTVPSLLFFVVFFLHMLLPLAIAVGLVVHLLRVSRIRLFPDWRLGVALTVGILLAAAIIPAPLDPPARMALKPEVFTVDAWYLSPLALSLRFQHAGLWVAVGGAIAVAMSLPWMAGRRRKPENFQTKVEIDRCHACTQCVQDCPFDAVSIVARTDGKPFTGQAFVDPAKCVGCGVCVGSCDSEAMSLQWFDTRREEARIEAEVKDKLASTPWVAFVAGDIDSGFALFRATLWRERLPGYQVHFVPTASWVRPKLVERLLRDGVSGVLIVRDAKTETAARDGNRWVAARLSGERKPVFRVSRSGGSEAWRVVDFHAGRTEEFAQAALAFRAGKLLEQESLGIPAWRCVLGISALAVAIVGSVVVPSHLRVSNPAPLVPELVFSFKALGERVEAGAIDPAADADKPIHMRGRPTEKPHRAAVRVRLTIDGRVVERTFRAKGISQDGPAIDQWRQEIAAGPHAVAVEVLAGPTSAPQVWSGRIDATPRHLHVLTYEPAAGFKLE